MVGPDVVECRLRLAWFGVMTPARRKRVDCNRTRLSGIGAGVWQQLLCTTPMGRLFLLLWTTYRQECDPTDRVGDRLGKSILVFGKQGCYGLTWLVYDENFRICSDEKALVVKEWYSLI